MIFGIRPFIDFLDPDPSNAQEVRARFGLALLPFCWILSIVSDKYILSNVFWKAKIVFRYIYIYEYLYIGVYRYRDIILFHLDDLYPSWNREFRFK